MYFAAELMKCQNSSYNLEQVGMWLDYYIVYVPDKAILHMDLRDLDPVPLTDSEAKAYAFCNSFGKGYVKIHESEWEQYLFEREIKDEYEISAKGKIIYPITGQDEQDAVSLMKKILNHKTLVFIQNRVMLDPENQHTWIETHWSYEDRINSATSISEISEIYADIIRYLYLVHPE